MSKKTVYFKSTNLLIEEIKKQNNIEILKEPNSLIKLFKKQTFPDIYFHSGVLDEKAMKYIENSKITISNSFSVKNLIIQKSKLSSEKIEVIYPSINIDYKNIDELKEKYIEKFDFFPTTKLIFFTAKNFKTSGIKEFLEICASITYPDFRVIIAGSKQQIANLNFSLTKYSKLKDKLILLEDYKNIDELFLISDIFILPTQNKTFATNILKAMFCECVVFLPINNDAKEIIDVYASMERVNDPSTAFKIDAVLYDDRELNKIKIENKERAMECILENNLNKFNQILSQI
ncbi:glycosyltransferase [Aliarcobacter vitoriensis]|uniref:glycosyltransferase n=1 Tax=Aliarcobacter vitoriensis TaxID=2011099 RepID=UPI003AABB121